MTKVICTLCPRECRLSEGQVGWCRGRTCREGEVVSLNYGRLTSVALDPIEKKPLARFHPGSYILSVGSFGCNLHCPFCQNHAISQAGAEFATQDVMPADLVALAKELAARPAGNLGVAFTYNEPLIGYEFVRDTAKLLHEAGLKVVLVTNGMINAGPFLSLLPLVDAFNIDLKGWRQQVYDVCGGSLAVVKQNIAAAAAMTHVEVTTLVVPGLNDSAAEMEAEAEWLASISPELPLHVSRYFPRWQASEPATPVPVIYKLADIARKYLSYVYTGNC
ncbi:MAG: AmmeMemoRadiSam system radical SAM enzyme [Selenomonas sp.]|uniref:AmmeMemoRadiSam system radical SAM enzyme n=1 Tax=Selenomonas sp. TaxID=2053611 RepID=UPI0025E22C93|nr:AmmeMemoRadiSam system radical SAM enzyme [Selenomonas sp.]MCR5438218.1 AmmeMemoRadiSam system radical SAM enzyme [Selenomonas sp.]